MTRVLSAITALAVLIGLPALSARPAAAGSVNTYVVTKTSGDQNTAGSLPWAVAQANSHAGFDYVSFSLSGSGPWVISVGSPLNLLDQVNIAGKSQPGWQPGRLQVVGGSSIASLVYLSPGAANSTVEGLSLSGYTSNAITVSAGSDDNWIVDDWIGFRQNGASVTLNSASFAGTRGIGIQANRTSVTGVVIAGVENGITIGQDISGWDGRSYSGNSIRYSRIGTDPTGATSAGYGNSGDGVFLGAGAANNFLGPGDVVGGNGSSGFEMLHPSNQGNVVFANNIGTDSSGRAPIGNGELGVMIANGARGNAIGGQWGGNVISANALAGIALGNQSFPNAPGNWVIGNIVGLSGDQSAVVGSQSVGISVSDGATGNDLHGNAIAGATSHGVIVGRANGNNISDNWIGRSAQGAAFANGGYGVCLIDASWNWVQRNAFGANQLGNVGQFGTSTGNAIS